MARRWAGWAARAMAAALMAMALSSAARADGDATEKKPTATLTRYPYVQAVSATSAVIAWRTDKACESEVEFESESESTHRVVAGVGFERTPVREHAQTLSGLEPASLVHYRVMAGGAPVSALETFHTAPSPGSATAVSFLVLGDCGDGGEEQVKIATRMREQAGIDFVILTGDIVYPRGEASDYDAHFFVPYKDLLKSVPFFPSPGNHDYYWSPEAKAKGALPYLDAFHLPAGASGAGPQGTWYSFDWGPVHVQSLDVILEHAASGTAEVAWAERDLSASDAAWKVPFFHYPLYSGGPHGSNLALQATLGPIFDRLGADIVFAGHDHDYERTKRIRAGHLDAKGIVYVTTGGGGADLYPMLPRWFTERWSVVHHFLRVDADATSLRMRAIDMDGKVFDDLTLTKP